MKKLLFTITLLPSLVIQAGSNSSKEEETPPPAKTVTGFIALVGNKWPELAGYPELCAASPVKRFEEAFKKKLSPETLLLPVTTWNDEQLEGFSSKKNGVTFPGHLDFETLKNTKEGAELTLKISTITFLLTAKQTTKESQDRFEDVFKNQLKRALEGYLIYDTGKEKEELIKNNILEKKETSKGLYNSLHLLTENHRKTLELFLEEQK